jgi:hypothetical protein
MSQEFASQPTDLIGQRRGWIAKGKQPAPKHASFFHLVPMLVDPSDKPEGDREDVIQHQGPHRTCPEPPLPRDQSFRF